LSILSFLLFAQLEALPTQKKMTELETTSQNWDLFGEFLVWYASEEPSSIWANDTSVSIVGLNIIDSVDIAIGKFDWNYGFRVGAGHTMQHDRWDTQFYWSWFRTEAHSTIPTGNHLVYLEFTGSLLGEDLFEGNGAHLDWSLLYNMVDWELGRACLLSKALTFRPFIGIKGGWIDQNIHAQINLPSSTGVEHIKNLFWGAGPSGGINTKWEMFCISRNSLNLLGDISSAMMWGSWEIKDVYKNSVGEFPVKVKNSSLGSLMLRGFLGIGWDTHTRRFGFAAKLGYEMQIWFDQLRIPSVPALPLHNDLTLQGGTFNARFDF
jgi:hypothetical protein